MKKFLSILCAVLLTFSLSACNFTERESRLLSSSQTDSIVSDDTGDIIARILAEHPDAEMEEDRDGYVWISYYDGDDRIMVTVFPSGSVQTTNYGPDFYRENFPSYEEVQEQYPDKTVLVWAIAKTLYETCSPIHTRKVNEYLDARGCGYAVCFVPAHRYEYSPEMYPDQMLIEVKKRLNNGERIDIISPMNFEEFVFDGLYEPLDEYMKTDIGQELYNAFPKRLWESLRIDSGIYGVSGNMTSVLSPDRGYYVNAELAEKYNYDVTKPVLEQLDILKAVKENEKNTDVFSTYLDIDNIVSFVNVKMLSSAVYWNSDTHSAELSIDNPVYVEGLRMYDTLKREGLLKLTDTSHSDNFFIRVDRVCGGGVVYADMDTVDVDYFGNTVTAIPVFEPHSALRSAIYATGICSKSTDKEKAFELMTMVYTDPVLNNLLVYGVEGENYVLENGVVKELELPPDMDGFNINAFNSIRFANQMICHRSEDNLFTPEQYINIFEKAEVFADYDFALDPKNILSELNAEYIAADNISLPKDDQTLDEVLAAYREGLYAAGVQTIIDECNRQYEVYINEKN